MILWNLVLIFALIGLNGFFVAVEFAAVASRRSRLELLADTNSRSVQLVRNWLEDAGARERLIAASQLGVTTVSLALGAVGENTFQELLNPIFNGNSLPTWLQAFASVLPALPLVLSLVIVTSLTVVLGEQVPKVATLRGPESFALKAAPIMDVYSKVFKGFIHLLDGSTRLVLKLAGIPPGSTSTVYSLEELKQIVAGPEAEGIIEQPEREMLSAILDFGELVVRQVSLPRTEIVGIEADAPLEEVVNLVAQHTLTKYPVFEDNLDQIIGILHVHDLFSAWLDPSASKARRARWRARGCSCRRPSRSTTCCCNSAPATSTSPSCWTSSAGRPGW